MGKNKDKGTKNGSAKGNDGKSDVRPDDKAKGGDSDVKASAAEVPPEAKAASTRVHKEILDQFQDGGAKFKKYVNRVQRAVQVWLASQNLSSEFKADLAGIGEAMKEASPRVDDFLVHLAALKVKGFKPATAPRGPRFSIGQKVRVDDEWLPKSLESGFYTREELLDMTVEKISEKEILVRTSNGSQIAFRTAHLEPVDGGPSDEDLGDMDAFSDTDAAESVTA